MSSGGVRKVRILHISDLHDRGPREQEPWRREQVLGPAWERNLREIQQQGPIDLVCFTGDIAQSGRADEYESATRRLEKLMMTLGLDWGRLFVVPGNHDIDRAVCPEAFDGLRRFLAQSSDRQSVSRWMGGVSGPPPGVEGRWREEILRRQGAYRAWVRDVLRRPELAPQPSDAGMGYVVNLQLPSAGPAIHIVGLNTAWLAGDDADTGRLLLTENQFMGAAANRQGQPFQGIRIALMHHPLSDLEDGWHIRRLMRGYVDVVLRGHVHRSEAAAGLDPDRSNYEFAVGSLYEGHAADEHSNGCHVLEMSFDEQTRRVEGVSQFRSFSPAGRHWYDDGSIYRKAPNGRLRWSFAQLGPDETTGGHVPLSSGVSMPPAPSPYIGAPRRPPEPQAPRPSLASLAGPASPLRALPARLVRQAGRPAPWVLALGVFTIGVAVSAMTYLLWFGTRSVRAELPFTAGDSAAFLGLEWGPGYAQCRTQEPMILVGTCDRAAGLDWLKGQLTDLRRRGAPCLADLPDPFVLRPRENERTGTPNWYLNIETPEGGRLKNIIVTGGILKITSISQQSCIVKLGLARDRAWHIISTDQYGRSHNEPIP
jgi:3',5'-cyclic AMP phosphodiesterase CpdA